MEFIKDETEIPTPRIKLMIKESLWDKYELIEKNGIKYIQGQDLDEATKEIFEFRLIDSPLILWDLLELRNKLSKEIFSFNQKYINSHITDADIKLIISFCCKHGLPFWNSKPTANVFQNIEDVANDEDLLLHDIIPLGTSNIFPVPSFVVGLDSIYKDFLRLIVANDWQEDINIIPLLTDRDKPLLKLFQKLQAKNNTVDLYTARLCPYVTFWNPKLMSLQLNCNNLMHLSSYHLCAIQQAQDYSGGTIKICPKCKQMFIAKTPQQKFCNNPCTRQSYYASKKRKK